MDDDRARVRLAGARQYAVVAVKLALTALLLWAVVRYGIVDPRQLAGILENPVALIVSGGLILGTIPIAAYRWQLLLRGQGIELALLPAMKVVWLAVTTGLVLPGTGSGEAIRVGYVAMRMREQLVGAMTSVVVDRIVAAIGLVFVGLLLALPLYARIGASPELLTLIAGFVVLLAAALGLFLITPIERLARAWLSRWPHGRVVGFVLDVLDAARAYRRVPGTIAVTVLLSVALHLVTVLAAILISVTLLGDALPPLGYGFAIPASLLANLVPITPGGLGVGEAAFDTICRWLAGGGGAVAFGTAFLAYRAVQVASVLAGALLLQLPVFSAAPVQEGAKPSGGT